MRQTQKQRRKTPSFSSTLLDAIYHSIDEPTEHHRSVPQRRNAAQVDEEIESLRRAIMVEKWMENYSSAAKTTDHHRYNSASSVNPTTFTSSETDSSASLPTLKPLFSPAKIEGGRFTRTKIRALKMYGDLKKVKEPISPGGRIANFLNSIFSPRNSKKNQSVEDWRSVRKSRSMKDYTITTSCLSKNPNSSRSNKSKRSVRFCPISVILDEGDGDKHSINAPMPKIGCNFIEKNIDGMKNARNRKFHENDGDFDDKSCCSSDLFELENIGGAYDEELPVYGTTDLKMNRAIASGLIA